jgi:hypothetical protein
MALIWTKKSLGALAIALSLSLGLTAPLKAQLSGRLTFEQGSDMTVANGTLTGSEYRDLIIRGKAGQTLSVSLADDGTGNPEDKGSIFFNILPPGSNGVGIYNSSTKPNDLAKIKLTKNGDYKIRVYLMGEAKDGNHTVPFSLSVMLR